MQHAAMDWPKILEAYHKNNLRSNPVVTSFFHIIDKAGVSNFKIEDCTRDVETLLINSQWVHA
jgi:hypothetical protein